MTDLVGFRREGDVAVITIDNPPVNALKHAVRAGLVAALERAREDGEVGAVVLACAGRTFVAGADITEFGKPAQPPILNDVIAVLDASRKPTVAAVFGTVLGGGLELALGAHHRVAAPGTRLGLPEIKLGIIPGGGGTQRLPRLIGMERALPMILSGEPIGAEEALAAGLVDEIATGDLVAAAAAFARRMAGETPRRARDRDDKLADMRDDPARFDALAAEHTKRARGLEAPAAAVEALRGALTLPFEDGLKREREIFAKLVGGEQSRAQRHIFFAEREAAKIPGLPPGTKAREVARAAVIGAGTMGGGIAMCFANAGIPVTIVEASPDALARGMETIRRNYAASAARGGLAAGEGERRLGLIADTTDFGAIADADLVIEAVFEEMDVKKTVFAELDRLAKPGAVLATNTSYLDVNAIAAATARPEAVVGMHFFSPANVMRLLEVVRAEKTAPDVLATTVAVGRRIGKAPAVVGVCHGFVGNRMLRVRSTQAERLLLEGALPGDIDAAMVEFGFPMGPLAASDLAGLDIGWRMRKAQGARAEVADTLCERGRFGQKTGAGFFRYEAGARKGLPDPEVEDIIVEASRRLGVPRRRIERREIVEQLMFPMINEGARILEEGIAARPGDIDVIWVYGYGFPIWRGGPMFYADGVGLPAIRDRLSEIAAQSGDARLAPAPLLARLAAEERGFASLGTAAKAMA